MSDGEVTPGTGGGGGTAGGGKAGGGTAGSGTVVSRDPRTGRVVAELQGAGPAEVRAAVGRCRSAQQLWAATPLRERRRALERVRERFLTRAEELVAILVEENGKPEAEAWLSEIIPDGDLFAWWLKEGPAHLKRERLSLSRVTYPGKTAFIEYVPCGVLALVTPWNLPVAIPLRTLVPALLAGNGVVLKPSELAPRAGAFLGRLFAETLPEGLVEVVQGGGATGAALVSAEVDAIFFTGSVETGRKVARAAAERLVPVSLELGGKDAAVVLADADLDRAARGVVWGAFFNAGQNCAAVERVYVERSVADAFVAKVREQVSALRLGEDLGPMTAAFQRDKVEAQLRAAREAGAELFEGGGSRAGAQVEGSGPGAGPSAAGSGAGASTTGGGAGPGVPAAGGFWLRPVVVTGAADDAPLFTEETFGPVLPIRVVEDAEEALRLANHSPYGLTASVWTRDLRRGEDLARRLEAGVLTVNNHGFTGGLPQAPWSGVKGSGPGVTSSHLALHALVRPRLLLVDRSRARRELWWYPYDAALLGVARALRDLALGRVGALGRLLSNLRRRGR